MSEEDLEIRPKVVIPGWELWFTATRSGGPGGQHANTSSTRVTLHWSMENSSVLDGDQKRRVRKQLKRNITDEGVLQVSVADSRSQHRNRQIARERMAKQVAKALQKKKRRVATRPSRSAKRRRLKKKRQRGKKKELRKPPTKHDW